MAYVTAEVVAEHFNVSLPTVRRWTSEKRIPFRKIGRTVRYSLEEISEASIVKEGEKS